MPEVLVLAVALLLAAIALCASCIANVWLLARSRSLARAVRGLQAREELRLRLRGRRDALAAVASAEVGPVTPRGLGAVSP